MGAVITHVFQRLAAGRSELFARAEALRQERIATYSAFAAAAEEYRHGQATRWYRRAQDPDSQDFVTARDEAHRLRTAARQVCYRVQLITDGDEVTRAAEHAYACTRDISTAQSQAEQDTLDTRARQAIEAFVTRASPRTR